MDRAWRRRTGAFWLACRSSALFLGFALASKWVAAYAIGGARAPDPAPGAPSGRLLTILGLIGLTTVLGYVAISVPEGQSGGNYLFLAIMVALT